MDLDPEVNIPDAEGLATGTIQISGVPTGDLVAAYLYWEAVHPFDPAHPFDPTDPEDADNPARGVKFRGLPIGIASIKASTRALTGNTSTCWGAAGQGMSAVSMLRADVLPLMPKLLDADGKWTGKYRVNGDYPVSLRETSGDHDIQSAGASLFLVYRDPSEPLRKIVVYDGAYTAYGVVSNPETAVMSQTIGGFYKSASATSVARISHLVGTGGNNQTEQVTFNGSQVISEGDPFPPTSPSSDRSWAAFTRDVDPATLTNSADYGETVTTTVTASGSPKACRAWGAVMFSIEVADVDHDGLPDGLEDAANGLKDPNDKPLPKLKAMGAGSDQRDLFVEFNAMWARGADPTADPPFPGTTYGSAAAPFNATTDSVTDVNGHHHAPTPAMLEMIGDRFAAQTPTIRAHFDVGNVAAYHGLGVVTHSEWVDDYTSTAADEYLVGNGIGSNVAKLATGGELIREVACVADAEPGVPETCQFPDYPGTVGWKFGFEVYRDAPVGPGGEELETPPSSPARRRFDPERKGLFHYLLYAHARGKPTSSDPCVDANDTPTGAISGMCRESDGLEPNPYFHRPTTASGIADLPGGNAMVTLGLWDEFVGQPFVRASTTFHEIGHNLNLWHGGNPAVFGDEALGTSTFIEPNCKPNYLSSMSYLFQVHGLYDQDGALQLDFSGTALNSLDETAGLADFTLNSPYRPSWFAPAGSGLATDLGATKAKRFCNGAQFDPLAPPAGMARVHPETYSAGWAIDWDGDGSVDTSAPQNVNFDGNTETEPAGTLSASLSGFNDWGPDGIRMDQIIAGPNALGYGAGVDTWELVFGSGDGWELVFGNGETWELAFGSGDGWELVFGNGDAWELVFGSADSWELVFGNGDTWELVFGNGDGWELVFGNADVWELVFGNGDGWELVFGNGDGWELVFGNGQEDLTREDAEAMGRSAPRNVVACVIGVDCPAGAPDAPLHRTYLTWDSPGTFGTVLNYHVFRKRADAPAGTPYEPIGAPTPDRFITDEEELAVGQQFQYRVKGDFGDVDEDGDQLLGPASVPSTPITAVNDAPEASDDPSAPAVYATVQNTPLTIAAPGVLENDTDGDSPASSITAVAGTFTTAHGGTVVLAGNGGFTYTPAAGFFGVDSFTYTANDGLWSRNPGSPDYQDFAASADSNAALVTIAVNDVTPPVVTVTVPAPNGLAGYFVTAPVGVAVSATDPSGVTSFSCTDNGSPIGVGTLAGIGTPSASGVMSVAGEGTHNLVCLATDAAGNTGNNGGPNTGNLKIDTVAPETTINSGPSGEITVATATFTFSGTDATSGVASFECKLDGAAFTACTSPRTYTGLAIGPHTFNVRAKDNAGNIDGTPATRAFKVIYTYISTTTKTVTNIGSAVPITWQLKDPAGNPVTSLSTLLKMESVYNGPAPASGCVASATGTTETLFQLPSGATGGSTFRVAGGEFKFNWDTTTATTAPVITGKGCYTVLIYLSDTSTAKMTPSIQLK
jgi:hypothetical protein